MGSTTRSRPRCLMGLHAEEITLVPRPVNLPVECWQPIQSATPRGLDFMARHGIKGIIGGGVAEGGAMHRVIESYLDANTRAGRDLELARTCASDSTSTSPTHRRRRWPSRQSSRGEPQDVRPAQTGARPQRRADRAMSDPSRAPKADLPRIEDVVRNGGFLAGPSDLIIEQLKKVEESYPGMERVSVSPAGRNARSPSSSSRWSSSPKR